MNRNVESHFAQIPRIDIHRSIFDRSSSHKTSFNVGQLIPFYLDEVLPGDSFRVTTSKVVRLQTMLTPIMDNMYLDTYYFFVPCRLVWDHWKEFMGENTESAWLPETKYQMPSISAPPGGFASGSIADYMGLPVGVEWNNDSKLRPSALPFRAYALICDSFFRDENVTDPLNIPKGDSNQTGTNGSDYISDVANGGMPFIAAKYHDSFTSALPAPQKGEAVTFPLLSGSLAPVAAIPTAEMPNNPLAGRAALHWDATTPFTSGQHQLVYSASNEHGTFAVESSVSGSSRAVWPENLVADLSENVGAVSINELRLAFQLQKFYERMARGGSRYIETLKAHFGVTSPDARLQRPEYLGGNRVTIAVHEVTNNAQSEADFLGDLGAKSSTSDIHEDFQHSFTEHGYIIGLCVARYDHSYSQGLERMWYRRNMEDFYWPVFANIGEQPVYQSELMATTANLADKTVFGFQEAWYEYRYKPNRVSGEMRPGVPNSLASWHLSDYYEAPPTLSDEWIREDKTNVDRVLAVTSKVSNQVFADIYVKNIATRPMPLYSIPGLIDHN